ncbi:MAG: M20 family metallo-hydrolase [Planctomycetes bacterium]|nr:M20 family metallo-hydrolase [Planctomycetota bacterium]MBI3844940.1 M20 family metallo-hydrolase [Planctomycetota bacterium]
MNPSIDKNRLFQSIEDLGGIGGYLDERTGLRGVNRLALTDADAEGRRYVVATMKSLGLDVTVDRIGNLFGRRAGRDAKLRPVMMGSHVDSVPTAGKFDGCLGVLGALEVVRTLDAAKVTTRRPIVVAAFTDEEGSRFGTDMVGSAVASGRLLLEQAYALRDRKGCVFRDELERIGFLGNAKVPIEPPHAYVECHIEQGPILRASGFDIGVVTSVQAISWREVTISGKSGHAGATPIGLRADAGLAASRLNVKLREMATSGRYGKEMRATMGAIAHEPGLVNIVPGRATLTVDLRNPDDAMMKKAEADLLATFDEISKSDHVEIAWRQTARTPVVPFHSKIQALVAEAAAVRGLRHEKIASGAGQDAQEFAPICPSGMVFIPGEYDGVSHNPREYSTPEQCANGINVLLDVALRLADEEGGP